MTAPYKAVLLVEGVSEVRLFQQLLANWKVRNQVVVVPMGGDDLASKDKAQELCELHRLSEQVFAVVDSERLAAGGAPKSNRAEFAKTCAELSIDCLVLERRSIENYLDIELARRVQRAEDAPNFGHYEKPPSEWAWSKDKNWRIAQAMDRSHLDGTDLGSFLDRLANACMDRNPTAVPASDQRLVEEPPSSAQARIRLV